MTVPIASGVAFCAPGSCSRASRRAWLTPARIAVLALFALLIAAVWQPQRAGAALSPHGNLNVESDSCRLCHRLHDSTAFNQRPLAGESETQLCLACHDDAALGAQSSVESTSDAFDQPSHHTLEDAPTASDLTNTCGSCHNPHLDPAKHPHLIKSTINGAATAKQSLSDLCLDCHDDTPDWRKRGYNPAHPQRDAHGFPIKGTFPGKAAYHDARHNPHSSIPADSPFVAEAIRSTAPTTATVGTAAMPAVETSGTPTAGASASLTTSAEVTPSANNPDFEATSGDCRNCHGVHGGPGAYDLLTSGYRPTTAETLESDLKTGAQAELCFRCHAGQARWVEAGAADIESLYTTTSAEPDVYSGHRIVTSGGSRPARSPLLCADCHNPHGSGRGNDAMIGDDVGAGLELESAEDVRAFCLSCHTADDGRVWDSEIEGYRAVSPTETIAGLRRDGTLLEGQRSADPSSTTNWLALSPLATAHSSTDVESCYACHGGREYGASTGNDVHNPSVKGFGDSIKDSQTKPCYDCHGMYQQFMEDGSGSHKGAARTDVFHHVLGGSRGDGDISSSRGVPEDATELYCTTCHRGHTADASDMLSSIRSGVGEDSSATSDYSDAAPYGLCVSCHDASLAKDTVNQKSDGTARAASIRGGAGDGGFGASAHDYVTQIEMPAGDAFGLNCGKCHGGTIAGSDTTTASATTHWSADRHLLAGLGTEVVDPVKEILCFRCHATRADAPNAAPKPKAGRDYYDAASMSAAAESVYRSFRLASRHPVAGSATGNVTCSNCHNAHAASAGSPVSDPANTYSTAAYSTAFERTRFCLGCHSGSAPSARADATTYVPTTVVIAPSNATLMNKGANFTRGHSSANGSISSGEVVACDACHDKHGSTAPKLLGRYSPSTGRNAIGSTTITANDASVCYACHTVATASTQSADANGYPTNGRWPGRAVYTGAFGMHNSSAVRRPGSTTPAGDCKNCHNVHGTSAPYDELVGRSFTPTYYGFCFDCHGPGNPKGFNQSVYFPISAGGTSTSANAGHATRTAGIRPAGSPMPCYDCHNNHGSGSEFGLEVHSPLSASSSVIVGDTPGELEVTTATGVRNFCFTCHTTSDTAAGWNGSAMVAISSGAKVEGIDRVSTAARLRLPSNVSAHRRSASNNCESNGCHGRSYSGTGANNVHSPRVP